MTRLLNFAIEILKFDEIKVLNYTHKFGLVLLDFYN
jgi:hypothetical protein